MADEMIGRTGRCKLNVQKDKTGQYPDKNGIADYLKSKTPNAAPKPAAARQKMAAGAGMGADLDDEVPFSACWQ